jgi:hypothetical protein
LSSFQKVMVLQMKKIITSSPRCPDDDTLRQEKVLAIRRELEAGTYRVDNRILADTLLFGLLWEQLERLRLLSLDLLKVVEK